MKHIKLFESKLDTLTKTSDIWCVFDRNDNKVIELSTNKDAVEKRCEEMNLEFNSGLKFTGRPRKERQQITKYYTQTLESAIDDIIERVEDRWMPQDESY